MTQLGLLEQWTLAMSVCQIQTVQQIHSIRAKIGMCAKMAHALNVTVTRAAILMRIYGTAILPVKHVLSVLFHHSVQVVCA